MGACGVPLCLPIATPRFMQCRTFICLMNCTTVAVDTIPAITKTTTASCGQHRCMAIIAAWLSRYTPAGQRQRSTVTGGTWNFSIMRLAYGAASKMAYRWTYTTDYSQHLAFDDFCKRTLLAYALKILTCAISEYLISIHADLFRSIITQYVLNIHLLSWWTSVWMHRRRINMLVMCKIPW